MGGRDPGRIRSRMLLTAFPIYLGSDVPPRADQQSGCLFMLNVGEKGDRKFHFLKKKLIKWEDYSLSSSETELGDGGLIVLITADFSGFELNVEIT